MYSVHRIVVGSQRAVIGIANDLRNAAQTVKSMLPVSPREKIEVYEDTPDGFEEQTLLAILGGGRTGINESQKYYYTTEPYVEMHSGENHYLQGALEALLPPPIELSLAQCTELHRAGYLSIPLGYSGRIEVRRQAVGYAVSYDDFKTSVYASDLADLKFQIEVALKSA